MIEPHPFQPGLVYDSLPPIRICAECQLPDYHTIHTGRACVEIPCPPAEEFELRQSKPPRILLRIPTFDEHKISFEVDLDEVRADLRAENEELRTQNDRQHKTIRRLQRVIEDDLENGLRARAMVDEIEELRQWMADACELLHELKAEWGFDGGETDALLRRAENE